MGSVKQIWNTLSPLSMTAGAEAEGVIINRLSLAVSAATAMDGVVVTGPARTCRPQSFRVL